MKPTPGPLPKDEFDHIFSRVPRLSVEVLIVAADAGACFWRCETWSRASGRGISRAGRCASASDWSRRYGGSPATNDAREAMVGSVAHSGRVIFAAGAVMVAVFFTFALSGPLPPKEMGIILGVAVFLDAALIRLLLLPVLLRLMGRWAWYLPRWAHRVLPNVTFGQA